MIHANKNKYSNGFTLIELMLAMSFVAALLLAIALTIIQVGNIYSKGMALKDINQSARSINEDIKRTVSAAGSISLDSTNYATQGVSGRLCLGEYSYVWNTIDAKPTDANAVKVSTANPALITLIRVPDASRAYCSKNTAGALVVQGYLRAADVGKFVNLLAGGDHVLSMTKFSVNTSNTAFDSGTGQRLFTVSYGIGTGKPTAMASNRLACLPPSNLNADPIYCNVQNFEMVVRSGEGV